MRQNGSIDDRSSRGHDGAAPRGRPRGAARAFSMGSRTQPHRQSGPSSRSEVSVTRTTSDPSESAVYRSS